MTLSDEDYGILYNAIEQERSDHDVYLICRNYTEMGWEVIMVGYYHLLDFAAFIILSEGRELP